MEVLIYLLVSIIALLHVYFMILEMFLWTKPKGLKTFGLSKEQAQNSQVLAANQGLYNGFLAAGLTWGLLSNQTDMVLFFLICVSLAGIYGAYSTKKILLFYIQAIPAIIALLLILLSSV